MIYLGPRDPITRRVLLDKNNHKSLHLLLLLKTTIDRVSRIKGRRITGGLQSEGIREKDEEFERWQQWPTSSSSELTVMDSVCVTTSAQFITVGTHYGVSHHLPRATNSSSRNEDNRSRPTYCVRRKKKCKGEGTSQVTTITTTSTRENGRMKRWFPSSFCVSNLKPSGITITLSLSC